MKRTRADDPEPSAGATVTQRIDKWLWCARLFKTRSLASKFVADNPMRLTRNGATQRVERASFLVRADDEMAFELGDRLRILRIIACAQRRGPAVEARTLYEDLSPPPPPRQTPAPRSETREKGAGRPTKKERRAIDAFKSV